MIFWKRRKKTEFDLMIERALKMGCCGKQISIALDSRPRSKESQELIDLEKANQEKAEKEYQEFYDNLSIHGESFRRITKDGTKNISRAEFYNATTKPKE